MCNTINIIIVGMHIDIIMVNMMRKIPTLQNTREAFQSFLTSLLRVRYSLYL